MPRSVDSEKDLLCSFCGKSQGQVQALIAGPGVCICDECVGACNEILEQLLLDVQFELPSQQDARTCVVSREMVESAFGPGLESPGVAQAAA